MIQRMHHCHHLHYLQVNHVHCFLSEQTFKVRCHHEFGILADVILCFLEPEVTIFEQEGKTGRIYTATNDCATHVRQLVDVSQNIHI